MKLVSHNSQLEVAVVIQDSLIPKEPVFTIDETTSGLSHEGLVWVSGIPEPSTRRIYSSMKKSTS
ncbi:MAG: hypothetical protein AAF517_03660 [Planctomycetota bacterium]